MPAPREAATRPSHRNVAACGGNVAAIRPARQSDVPVAYFPAFPPRGVQAAPSRPAATTPRCPPRGPPLRERAALGQSYQGPACRAVAATAGRRGGQAGASWACWTCQAASCLDRTDARYSGLTQVSRSIISRTALSARRSEGRAGLVEDAAEERAVPRRKAVGGTTAPRGPRRHDWPARKMVRRPRVAQSYPTRARPPRLWERRSYRAGSGRGWARGNQRRLASRPAVSIVATMLAIG